MSYDDSPLADRLSSTGDTNFTPIPIRPFRGVGDLFTKKAFVTRELLGVLLWIYYAIAVLAGIAFLFTGLAAMANGGIVEGVISLVIGFVLWLVYMLFARFFYELGLLLFKTYAGVCELHALHERQ